MEELKSFVGIVGRPPPPVCGSVIVNVGDAEKPNFVDLSSEGLWVSIGESLDILSLAQENHQHITTTIVGKIEAQNRKLVTESSEFLDFQTRRLLEENFKDTENQVRTLVADFG
jgi:hypothetical protein